MKASELIYRLARAIERLQQRERAAAAKAWKNEGKVLDWRDKQQEKYRAVFDCDNVVVRAYCYNYSQGAQPYFPSVESLLAFYDTLSEEEQKLLCTGVE